MKITRTANQGSNFTGSYKKKVVHTFKSNSLTRSQCRYKLSLLNESFVLMK